MPQSAGYIRYVFVALTLQAKWATMLAPQQTIVRASANLRCEGADASLPTLIFLDFEHPNKCNHPKPTVLYVPQYVANFVYKKSCSIWMKTITSLWHNTQAIWG